MFVSLMTSLAIFSAFAAISSGEGVGVAVGVGFGVDVGFGDGFGASVGCGFFVGYGVGVASGSSGVVTLQPFVLYPPHFFEALLYALIVYKYLHEAFSG